LVSLSGDLSEQAEGVVHIPGEKFIEEAQPVQEVGP
jgi:hypothetical protein